jgi:ketosteroid isomerase-like protein
VIHLDLVRDVNRAWRDEGLSGIVSRYEEFFTDDFEWCPPMREMTGARYVGRQGLEQYAHDLGQVLTSLDGELEEIIEIAPDVLRATVRLHTHGKVSGVTMDAPMIAIARFRDERIALAWASYDPEASSRAAEAIVKGEPVPV